MNTNEHLLTCTQEEAIEIAMETSQIALRLAQVISKAKRFGLSDVNFLIPDGPDNRQRLVDELNDLLALITMLESNRIIPHDWLDFTKQQAKIEKVKKCMELSRRNGVLE